MEERQSMIACEIPNNTEYALICATCSALLATFDHSLKLEDRILIELQAIGHIYAYTQTHDVCGYRLGSGGLADSPYRVNSHYL